MAVPGIPYYTTRIFITVAKGPATGPSLETDQFGSHFTACFPKIHANVIVSVGLFP